MRVAAITGLVAICLTSPVVGQEQINLRCIGISTSSSNGVEESKPYETLFRIDLAEGKWCEDDCRAIFDIHAIQPTQITLSESSVDTPREQSFSSNFINRTTGRHLISAGSRYPSMGIIVTLKYEGQCELEPFEGFPQVETKF